MINIRQLIDLWKASFNDSEEFVRLYFERVYRKENTLVKMKDENIVAALQMVPYTMSFCGGEIPVSYIAGASTAQEERGKGLMTELLDEAFQAIAHRHIPLAVLIPSDHSLIEFYQKSGFHPLFEYSLNRISTSSLESFDPRTVNVTLANDSDNISAYMYFQKKIKSRKCCIQHTYTDFITILKDLELDGGAMFVARNKMGMIKGLAFAVPMRNELDPTKIQLVVKELVCSDENAKRLLLLDAARSVNASEVIYLAPATEDNAIPFGLAKITDRAYLTRRWLEYTKPEETTKEDLDALSEEELMRLIFDYENKAPFMSLMLD